MHNFFAQQILVPVFVAQRILPSSCTTSEFWFSVPQVTTVPLFLCDGLPLWHDRSVTCMHACTHTCTHACMHTCMRTKIARTPHLQFGAKSRHQGDWKVAHTIWRKKWPLRRAWFNFFPFRVFPHRSLGFVLSSFCSPSTRRHSAVARCAACQHLRGW